VTTIPTAWGPWGVAYDSSNGDLYVTDLNSNEVSVVSPANNSVIATVPVGEGPMGLAYDSANGDIYVADGGITNVSVISGSTNVVVATIELHPSNCGPTGLAYDPADDAVYVALECGTSHGPVLDNVSVISAVNNTVVANIPVGVNPVSVAYDNVLGYVYVVNQLSNNTSVIRTTIGGGGSATLFGLPSAEAYAVLAGAAGAVVAAVAVGVWVLRRGKAPPIPPAPPAAPASGSRPGPP
jgi:YVTN family beta-propeller protein